MEVLHERCSKCKCWRLPAEFLNPKGRKLKTCGNCRALSKIARDKNKCEHKRQKSHCIECGGSQICEHNRTKQTCKDCGGVSVCEHKRQKSQCTECGGVSVCEHKRQKSQCKECGGASICEHNRRKSRCKECGGASICEHNRRKSQCKECGGSQICEHKRHKPQCKECDPNGHLKNKVHTARSRIDWTDQERKPVLECLGCDIEFYRTYLTDLFKVGMNWENYGDWEIDHIIPLNFENPTFEQAFKRLHYTNTQPMWKAENRSKGNKLTV